MQADGHASPSDLIGREDELARIESATADVDEGLSAVLVVRGEAGIGKTTLVRHAICARTTANVIQVTGIESEMELPHAALHRLLQSLLPRIDSLPSPQYLALATTFALRPGPPPDPFMLGLATLTLLAEEATERPLLCVIDDAQWLDKASIDTLTFVTRRLVADRIGMFFCVRDQNNTDDAPFSDLPELRLRPLDDKQSLALLERKAGRLDSHVARRIVTAACGNPLAVTEFARQLTPEELSGEHLTAGELPLSGRIEAHYLREIRGMSATAQTVLLLAAVEPSAEPEMLWQAALRIGVDEESCDDTLDALWELLTFRPGVVFRHPLIKSAVHGGASPTRRREAHQALAAVLDDATDPDRRSWHLAAASSRPDEDVAAHLERSAGRARARGGYAAESAFLVRAAELTPDFVARGVRLLDAAEAALQAGDYRRCEALLARAEPNLADRRSRARAERMRGASLSPLGRPDEAPAVLMASAQALGEFDPALAKETWSGALSAAWLALSRARGTTLCAVAQAILATPDDDNPSAEDLLRTGIATRIAVDYPTAVPILREAIDGMADSPEDRTGITLQPMLVYIATYDLWDLDTGRRLLQLIAQRERDRGGLMGLWLCLHNLAYLDRWAGLLDSARAYQEESWTIRESIGLGQSWKFPGVEVNALLGRDTELQEAVTRLEQRSDTGVLGASTTASALSLAVNALSRRRYDEAYRHALAVHEEDAPVFGNQILPDLIEAATRTGHDEVARSASHLLLVRAQASGTDWARGLLSRSQALLASGDEAEKHYRDAIERLERARTPLDQARAHLLYGEWLRRELRRGDAVEQLRIAHDMFNTMGTAAFADRADTELAAAGVRADRRSVAHERILTVQEEQVARLAANGMTNREIATTLFISESTAAYHLKKVFRKIDVSSRRQLARHLGISGQAGGPPHFAAADRRTDQYSQR